MRLFLSMLACQHGVAILQVLLSQLYCGKSMSLTSLSYQEVTIESRFPGPLALKLFPPFLPRLPEPLVWAALLVCQLNTSAPCSVVLCVLAIYFCNVLHLLHKETSFIRGEKYTHQARLVHELNTWSLV